MVRSSTVGMASGNRAALITGSGRNMGRACAKELASMGFNVVVNGSRNKDDCERVADEVTGLSAMICDVRRRPFRADGSTVTRKSGASLSVEVI